MLRTPTIRRGELTADRSIRRGESYSGIAGCGLVGKAQTVALSR
jgi:hypothetical protein